MVIWRILTPFQWKKGRNQNKKIILDWDPKWFEDAMFSTIISLSAVFISICHMKMSHLMRQPTVIFVKYYGFSGNVPEKNIQKSKQIFELTLVIASSNHDTHSSILNSPREYKLYCRTCSSTKIPFYNFQLDVNLASAKRNEYSAEITQRMCEISLQDVIA